MTIDPLEERGQRLREQEDFRGLRDIFRGFLQRPATPVDQALLERLADYPTMDEWVRAIEQESPEQAQAIRKHIADTDAADQRTHRARRLQVEDVVEELDRPRWPSVDRGLPQTGRTFETFQPRPDFPSVEAAGWLVRQWCRGLDVEPMLTLSGLPGTGKTHLAQAAAHTVRGDLIYRTEAGLIGEAMIRMQSGSAESLLEALAGVQTLMVDDMGVAALRDWGQGVMDRLIDARYVLAQEGEGWTLITTNLSPSSIQPRVLRRLTEPGVSRIVPLDATAYFGGKRR